MSLTVTHPGATSDLFPVRVTMPHWISDRPMRFPSAHFRSSNSTSIRSWREGSLNASGRKFKYLGFFGPNRKLAASCSGTDHESAALPGYLLFNRQGRMSKVVTRFRISPRSRRHVRRWCHQRAQNQRKNLRIASQAPLGRRIGRTVLSSRTLLRGDDGEGDQRCSTSWLPQCGQVMAPSSTRVRIFENVFLQA